MKRTGIGHGSPWLLLRRSESIARRYGITGSRGKDRIRRCVHDLAHHGCLPTFPTPGRTVERDVSFFRGLADDGVEVAVHGYDHLDFRQMSTDAAVAELQRAATTFRALGLRHHGFRCPYLGYTDELLEAIPPGMFEYSSNRAVGWPIPLEFRARTQNLMFEVLARVYRSDPAELHVSLPRLRANLVEIPPSSPDDIQLCDGMGLAPEDLAAVWLDAFDRSHTREELFAPLCHPEVYDRCAVAFRMLLEAASRRPQRVWIAQLREIATWWRERSTFSASVSSGKGVMRVEVAHHPRARLLVRDAGAEVRAAPWSARYRVLKGRALDLPQPGPRPFVGLAPGASEETAALLCDLGYLVERGPNASECTVVLDGTPLTGRTLVDRIEESSGPLVRVAPWPDGARSALSIAGDLDALSLGDYALRLVRLLR